ncbi:unnamed protein product [Lepeophtheirus salmonis]|uniref:(salmon louse) hypothetical protein n=1 Tax=Lepeophtheirus salmonis TaxID=72036 RepID=A0A7R8CKS5_LEPSM|nr:unnamed protein product [Lepeophtheirus salmonis]CAF2850987.1 unnamed protein product [Lepeophtheirus salmonis]
MLRGGAGRIIFTPYFLSANILIILFLTIKYWSASNYEFQLLNKVHILEIELKSCKTTLVNSEAEFKHKLENLQTCQTDFQALQNQFDKLTEDFKLKSLDYDRLRKKDDNNKSSLDELSRKCVEDLEECPKSALEDCSSFAKTVSKENQTETEMFKQTINELNAELLQYKGHAKGSINNMDKQHMPDGELPDIDPEAVIVKSKPVNGMTFHRDENGLPLPILPHGDPNAPRPGPRFSVVNPPPIPKDDINNASIPKDNVNITNSSTERALQKLDQLKGKFNAIYPPKQEGIVANLNGKNNTEIDNGSSNNIKPKNLDAREAESIDYDGEDQDPNGAIDDHEKESAKIEVNPKDPVIK